MAIRAKKKPITNQIATAQNDITLNYIGKVLLNPDAVLSAQSAGQGIKIYEEMLYEARVASEFQKRKLAVIGKEWDIIPASDDAQDQKISEFVKEVIGKFSHDQSRQALLSGIITGFKPAEIMWEYSEGDIWIKELKGVSPRRFVFDLEGKLRLLTYKDMVQGEEIPDRKFMVFTNPSNNNSPYGDGLGRALYWPIWFKKNGVKFWAVFLDKFGQPTPWGKYPPGTDEPMQTKFLDSLKAMQTDQAIITPDTMSVELLEAARTSSVDSYDKWEKFWNDAITFILLGQSATTEGTPGKLGEETTRLQVADWIIKADADLLCEYENNQLIKWLVDYNFPDVKEYPKIWIRTEPEQDLKPLAERDRILIKEIGLPTPVSYIRDTYGIPEPEEGEEVIVPPTTQSPFGFAESSKHLRAGAVSSKQKKSLLHTADRRLHSKFAESDWIEAYMRSLAPSLKKLKGDALTKVESYLRSKSSPPSEEEFVSEIQGIIGSAYKKIDRTAITESVASLYQTLKAIPGMEVGFGGADIRAVNFLANLDHYYLSKFIDNPDAQAALQKFLKERFIEGGEALFGGKDPATIKEMQNLLSQHLTDLEGYQINRIADTGVTRIKNWSHLSQINDAGIVEIEIIEPTQECPFCAAMNGKIIQVDVAFGKMMDQVGMSPEEYEEDLKNNQPEWDDSMKSFNVEDFVDQGLLPPYHPHCRGSIIVKISQSA